MRKLIRKDTSRTMIKKGFCPIKPKKVYQYDLNGKLITVWDSVNQVQRMTNMQHQSISRAALGKRPHAYGFKWKYEI